MEGCQNRLGRLSSSLRFRLIVLLSLCGTLISALASGWSYYSFKSDSLQFLDDELTQVAASAINYDMAIPKRWEGPRRRHVVMFRGHDADRSTEPQSWLGSAELHSTLNPIIIAPLHGRSTDTIYIPAGIADGLYTMIIANIRARVLLTTHTDGSRFVVARSLEVTESMAARAFWASFGEFVLLSMLYVAGVAISLGLIFKAVTRLSEELASREANNLEPVDHSRGDIYIPQEMQVFIAAINQLLGRIRASLRSQQRFIADAAHEMRTPLTALSLQAESLGHEALGESAREKVLELQKIILRERQLLSSLLDLARVQMGVERAQAVAIDVQELFVSLIEELGSIADERDIDLGIEGQVSAQVFCSINDLRAVMLNLCSNALKYTPSGGQVDLLCLQPAAGIVQLLVRDSGPGIPAEELERVFEPFYRVGGDRAQHLGTGLGLAIAQAAAQRLGATLELRNRPGGGLEASLQLPGSRTLRADCMPSPPGTGDGPGSAPGRG